MSMNQVTIEAFRESKVLRWVLLRIFFSLKKNQRFQRRADHQQDPPHFELSEGLHGERVRSHAQGANYASIDNV